MTRPLACVFCLLLSSTLVAGTQSLVAVADNFGTGPGDGSIVGLGPDANLNVDAYFQSGVGSRTFAIEFDLSTLPSNSALISSATLQLTAPTFIDFSQSIDLSGYFGDGAIDLTDVQGTLLYSLLVDDLLMSDVGSVDVTSFIHAARDAGEDYGGFFASSDSPLSPAGGAHPHVYSSEWVVALERPMLHVTIIPEPTSGGLVIISVIVGWAQGMRNRR